MRVYCKNCKWYSGYPGVGESANYYCEHPSNLVQGHDENHSWMKNIQSPRGKNRNNNCFDYYRSWYRFWVKG